LEQIVCEGQFLCVRFEKTHAGCIGRLANGRLRILGPVDAPMARRAGRYRAQLLLQSGDRRLLHEVLRELRPLLEADPAARKVRWSIDVDPVELF
jgi:primosomal protein N' (replication factor Y)